MAPKREEIRDREQERSEADSALRDASTARSAAQQRQQPATLTTRMIAGSVGSIVTSLVVTPLDVVKVRTQAVTSTASAAEAISSSSARMVPNLPPNVGPCPRGCGTFVLNNGQMDCVLPKSAVSFFDRESGKLTEKAKRTMIAIARGSGRTAAGSSGSTSSSSLSLSQPGPIRMVQRIFMEEGFPGIYAGLRPTLVMAVPNTVLYFSAYDDIVYRLRRYFATNSEARRWTPLVAGGSARLLAATATAPFEYLRTKQASVIGQNQAAPGLWREFRTIVQADGFGALYRGLTPTLYRDVPFSAIYWFSLETFRRMWRDQGVVAPSPLQQAGQAFLNGAVAGMIAAAFTTPFDVVKTRQQAVAQTTDSIASQQFQAQAPGALLSACGASTSVSCCHDGAIVYKGPVTEAPSTPHRSASTVAYMRQIAETEGVVGLWRGNQARMLKAAPACAIMISSYELGKRLLEQPGV